MLNQITYMPDAAFLTSFALRLIFYEDAINT